jgi:hypothetical protein
VSECFAEEIWQVEQVLQVIELIFDAAGEALDRAIETRGSRRNSTVASTEGVLDHASEEAISLGSDRANELRAVVGLNGDLREVEAIGAEVIQAEGNQLGGVES